MDLLANVENTMSRPEAEKLGSLKKTGKTMKKLLVTIRHS